MAEFYKEMYNFEKVKESIPQIMFVNFIDDGVSTITCDKTYTEIVTALQSGKVIIAFAHNTTDNQYFQLTSIGQDGASDPVCFSAITHGESVHIWSYIISSSGVTAKSKIVE